MKLIALEVWKARYFETPPKERSLRRQLKEWEKTGLARKVAGAWYIDEHRWLANGDDLVEQALAA